MALRMLTRSFFAAVCVVALSVGVFASGPGGTSNPIAQVEATVAQLEGHIAELEARLTEVESILQELLRQAQQTPEDAGSDQKKSDSAAPSLAGAAWKRMSQNWEYRNAIIRPGHVRDKFVIELRRIGPPVSSAGMTVTLYDDEGHIVATGSGSVLSMATGDVRTVDFWLDASSQDARTWRLQVDYEF